MSSIPTFINSYLHVRRFPWLYAIISNAQPDQPHVTYEPYLGITSRAFDVVVYPTLFGWSRVINPSRLLMLLYSTQNYRLSVRTYITK